MSNQRTAFFNGEFIAEENARLHISDLSIQRGYGVFDFFRVLDKVPVFMDDHIDRFFRSAAGLRLEPGIDKAGIKDIIHELIERNNIALSGIKLTLTGGYSTDGYSITAPNLFITQQLLQPRHEECVKNGIKLITHDHVRELPEIKSINYLTGMLLHEKIMQAGAADALYCRNNEVFELPRSNFFIVTRDNVIVTPSTNILRGITRQKTLELAAKHFTAKEKIITVDDIRGAKEAFCTSTSKQIMPVVQIDDMVIGDERPGEVTRELDTQLQEVINNVRRET